jgi:sec-independent protein translocase protein TatB
MLGIDWEEFLVIVIVAVVVIGPKDMPKALRTAGRWIARVRRVSNHFKAGVEAMIREAEMEEMEKKWADQNAAILREHPADAPPEPEPTGAYPARPAPEAEAAAAETAAAPEAVADAEEPQLPFKKRKT